MKLITIVLLTVLVACGGGSGGGGNIVTPPPPTAKPDPYLTVRVRDQLDTTTAVGRAEWHLYALLTGPYSAQNGISHQGSFSLVDARAGHLLRCVDIGADSVGQRFLAVFALADTTTEQPSPDTRADSIVNAWYTGSRVLPAGWKALFTVSQDAWNSDQYRAGHGLTPSDPIRWGWDWSAAGSTNFYERAVSDTASCNRYP